MPGRFLVSAWIVCHDEWTYPPNKSIIIKVQIQEEEIFEITMKLDEHIVCIHVSNVIASILRNEHEVLTKWKWSVLLIQAL